jgi:hypothetical protein
VEQDQQQQEGAAPRKPVALSCIYAHVSLYF